MINIFFADDHAMVRSGLGQIFAITQGMQVVKEADNGDDVLAQLRTLDCNILLLDLNMPGISGPDLIARVKAHKPELPILVLSMHNTGQAAARSLKAGASGYVTKDCEPEILIEAIRRVAAGGRYVAAEIAQKMVLMGTNANGVLPHETLTDREFEIFILLTRGVSVNDIAAQLSISNKTVSTHKMRLMEKLNAASVADLMRYAMDSNLLT
jgi:DNA-binding NarL/FixJ family response regulator